MRLVVHRRMASKTVCTPGDFSRSVVKEWPKDAAWAWRPFAISGRRRASKTLCKPGGFLQSVGENGPNILPTPDNFYQVLPLPHDSAEDGNKKYLKTRSTHGISNEKLTLPYSSAPSYSFRRIQTPLKLPFFLFKQMRMYRYINSCLADKTPSAYMLRLDLSADNSKSYDTHFTHREYVSDLG